MHIRQTTIHEAWCSNCSAGQMEQIHDMLFKEKKQLSDLIGTTITCKCGHENVIDDVLIVIPTHFMVASSKDANKVKSNEELSKWLDKE